jgi:D-glycero-D-manno-heptose 1,7-bisphosphate phosphatase
MQPAKFVLLDRDGVINQDSDDFIKSPEEWLPIPRSLEAIALFNQHGYQVIVTTNQSGLGRGLFDRAMLERIHDKMQRMTAAQGGKIEAIYYCPHRPDENCRCRKPKPGLLLKFADDYKTTLEKLPFIGDSLRDIQAGLAVAASPILVKTGKGSKTLVDNPEINVPIFENLYDAAQFIISR